MENIKEKTSEQAEANNETAEEIIKPDQQLQQQKQEDHQLQQQQPELQEPPQKQEGEKPIETTGEKQQPETPVTVFDEDDEDYDDDDEEKDTSQKLVIDIPEEDEEEEKEDEDEEEEDDDVIALDDVPQAVTAPKETEKISPKPEIVEAIITLSDGEEDVTTNEAAAKPGKVQKRRSMGAATVGHEEERYRLKRRKINVAGAPKMPLTGK